MVKKEPVANVIISLSKRYQGREQIAYLQGAQDALHSYQINVNKEKAKKWKY